MRARRWGDWLPEERELARQFQVSRYTLRRSLEILREQDWLETRHGVGTRIIAPTPEPAASEPTPPSKISSGAGSLTRNPARTPQPAYCISKAALNMLTRLAAREMAPITVVSVSPGWIRTDMGGPGGELSVGEAADALAETIEQLTPKHSGQWIDRFGRPSEYAW